MTDSHPTHCLDCRHRLSPPADGCCSNPAVATLDELERAIYDDPYQPCPVFDPKVRYEITH